MLTNSPLLRLIHLYGRFKISPNLWLPKIYWQMNQPQEIHATIIYLQQYKINIIKGGMMERTFDFYNEIYW